MVERPALETSTLRCVSPIDNNNVNNASGAPPPKMALFKGIGLGLDGTPSSHMTQTCTWQHNTVAVTNMRGVMGP